MNGALKGYNATVLAYGQTGSGKTYTIGTGFDRDLIECQENLGIIPRAIRHLFAGIQAMQENPYDEDGTYLGNVQFSVAAQFMELYNEEIIDLLDPYGKGKIFKIHEDTYGSITVAGATIKPLKGAQDALNCLQQGAIARTTASTNMNEMRLVNFMMWELFRGSLKYSRVRKARCKVSHPQKNPHLNKFHRSHLILYQNN